ncbi:MAG: DUF3800 domain-containing protein [Candidatus Lokiarchaeota archaeon]|nr:DUF3800 domain-containing protein [Candidatus Lokiarchaeota archaeon]
MYFAYIDESGTPDPKDKHNNFYVLAAVVMQEKGLNYLNKEWDKLKKEIWELVKNDEDSDIIPSKFEIHMNDINGRRKFYESLNDDIKKWYNIVTKIYTLISRLFIKIMAVIIAKEDFYKEYPNNDPSKWAFELLVERINRFVIAKNDKEYGLIVMDSVNIETDNEKRKQIIEFMDRGTGHGWEEYPENIIISPFIVSSELHNGVQIVDVVVYLLRWYTRKMFNINPTAFFHQYSEGLLELVVQKFHEYPNLGSNTIRFFPTNTDVPEPFWNIFRV